MFPFGERAFKLRYAPLPGNAILTERTIGASVVLATGIAVAIPLGALLWPLAQVGALYREVDRLARTDGLTGWPTGGPGTLCLALLDLDQFKAYNDRHGHQAGDRLLKAAAAWTTAWRSPSGSAPPSRRAPARSGWRLDGRESADELITRADQALYAAKAGGRNRCLAARTRTSSRVP